MACKYIRKLVIVMMELLILILLKVKANDLAHISLRFSSPPIQLFYLPKFDKVQNNVLAPTSFSLSPLPILYPHSFELDEVQETIHTCLANKIKVCEETHLYGTTAVRFCIWLRHLDCLHEHHPKSTIKSTSCVLNCLEHPSDIGSCCKRMLQTLFLGLICHLCAKSPVYIS